MPKKEKLIKFTRPHVHGPHLSGPRVELTGRGKKVRVGVIGVAVAAFVVISEMSGNKGTTPGGSTKGTPGTSSSSGESFVPEVFRVGRHNLTVAKGQELTLNGVTFNRIYQGASPTSSWYVIFEPGFPVFTDGKKVRDPLLPDATCVLKDAGVNLTAKPPVLICDLTGNKGPVQKPFRHHGKAKN